MATKKFRVKDGHSVHHGVDGQKYGVDKNGGGHKKHREYAAGDVIELDEEEAAKMPWAIEPAEGKAATK